MTDKELQTLYNVVKIKYNPLEYTLADRVIIHKANLKPISEMDYSTEKLLLEVISNNLGKDKMLEVNEASVIHSVLPKVMDSVGHFKYYGDTGYNKISPYKSFMDYVNNLNFAEDNFMALVSMFGDTEEFYTYNSSRKEDVRNKVYKTKVLESIITLNVALRDSSSILKILKLATNPDLLSYSYEELSSGKNILDAIESDCAVLDIVYDNIKDSSICFPRVDATVPLDFVEEALSKSDVTTINTAKTYLSMVSTFNTVLYGIEILHAIYSIKEEVIKNNLLDLISRGWSFTSPAAMLFTLDSVTGNVTVNPEIQDIVNDNDNRSRFNKIRLYVAKKEVLDSMLGIADSFARTASKDYTNPPIFAELINFCNYHSIQCVRELNLLVLLRYIKSKGWDLDDGDEDVDEALDEAGDFIKELVEDMMYGGGEDETSTITEDPGSSMVDLHKESKGPKISIPTECKFKKTPALDSLDKEVSSFNDGMYKYDVKDVIDNSDHFRDKYYAIVENVSLINRDLIKRIKEIKTYNTGGKNIGLKSGKLDRKNIWKYQTTDKIFCNNTYKIKESDLAFGIILDVSGSMHGKGIENGIITMIILHETLKALGINHSIVTHTEHKGYHTCEIKRYQNFKEQGTYKLRKNYALAGITAESGNCDSAALKYMETAFQRVRNKDKICLIFSDGEPTECSDSELKEQVRHMEALGIKVIGIGINFPNIREYYRDNANGKNLKEMLDIVSNILKQYILDKKD